MLLTSWAISLASDPTVLSLIAAAFGVLGAGVVVGAVLEASVAPAILQTGRKFSADLEGLDAAIGRAVAERDNLLVKRPHVPYGTTPTADQIEDSRRFARALQEKNDGIRELHTRKAELGAARQRTVTALRLAHLLGEEPTAKAVPQWATDESRALFNQEATAGADLAELRARIVDLSTQALDLQARAEETEIRIRIGEEKPATLAAIRKQIDEMNQALAKTPAQVRILEGAVARFGARRAALETQLKTLWIADLESELKAGLQRIADDLRAAALEAHAIRPLYAALNEARPGGVPVGVPYFVVDLENEMAPLRRWLEHAIDLGWIGGTE